MKKTYLGYLELSFAQCCIGANIILGKMLTSSVSMYSLLFFRFFIGVLIAGLIVLCTDLNKTKTEYKSLSSRDWFIIFLQAISGGFLFNVFILMGLQYTTATVTGIINSAVPALVAIFSFFLLKERLNSAKSIAILLCIVGISILSFGKTESVSVIEGAGGSEFLGIILVLLAIIPEAMFTIFAKFLKKEVSPMANTLLVNLFNAILFIPFCYFQGDFTLQYDFSIWAQIGLYGLSGGILFFVFWYRGIAHVSANTAALFMGVMPVSTTLLAFLFLDEMLSIPDGIGLICVVSAIYFGTRTPKALAKT